MDYPGLLRKAMDAAGVSRRKLSFQLAERTGNKQASEYRAVGKYLAGEEPSRDRAAVLAVILAEPLLALVSDRQGRRNVRLAELARAVDDLLTLCEDLKRRVTALEQGQRSGRRPASGGR